MILPMVKYLESFGVQFHYGVKVVNVEFDCKADKKQATRIDVIADGTILEAYVDGKVALGTRMYDQTGGCFGLYASDGKAVFRNIKIFRA